MTGRIHIKSLSYNSQIKGLHENCRVIADIGCGDHPYEEATIFVDKFPETNNQRGSDLVVPAGKKFVHGDIENLPFGDKEIDFLHCRYVLEHVENPARACQEIIRVAKRGYLETPSIFWMFLFRRSHNKHRWIINIENNKLVFVPNFFSDTFNGFFDNWWARDPKFRELMFSDYIHFFNCFYFENDFAFEVREKPVFVFDPTEQSSINSQLSG
ncbi:MAG: class I SAM-dependent methyltransferase [Patescibacteria group bacterium]|jgi:ubiquinone/menaquinone biosynthesis C-methylase UbiE